MVFDGSCKEMGTEALATSVLDGKRQVYSRGTIINATMLMILMSGLTAGPAVSL